MPTNVLTHTGAGAHGDWHCSVLSAVPEGLRSVSFCLILIRFGLRSNVIDCTLPVMDSHTYKCTHTHIHTGWECASQSTYSHPLISFDSTLAPCHFLKWSCLTGQWPRVAADSLWSGTSEVLLAARTDADNRDASPSVLTDSLAVRLRQTHTCHVTITDDWWVKWTWATESGEVR